MRCRYRPLVDSRDSRNRPLKIILEEALSTGVESVCLVVSPATRAHMRAAGDRASGCILSSSGARRVWGMRFSPAQSYVGQMCFCIWWAIIFT